MATPLAPPNRAHTEVVLDNVMAARTLTNSDDDEDIVNATGGAVDLEPNIISWGTTVSGNDRLI